MKDYVRRGFLGLMDNEDVSLIATVRETVAEFCTKNKIASHELRCRNSGTRLWIQLHLLFDDHILLRDAHGLATHLERHLQSLWPDSHVITHLETKGDHDKVHGTCHDEVIEIQV